MSLRARVGWSGKANKVYHRFWLEVLEVGVDDDGVGVEVGGGIKGMRWVRSRPLENTVTQKKRKS